MTRYKQAKQLRNTEASYISGLVDGEGTITLSRRHRNENRQLVVSISSNERVMLEYVQQVSGVGVITKKRASRASHGINHTYKVSNRQALALLQQLLPYLKSYKKHRAQLVLDNYLAMTPRNGKYSKDLLQARKLFVKRFFAITPKYTLEQVRQG